MRKLLTFIVILGGIMSLMDHVHIPPNTAAADTQSAVVNQETAKKDSPEKIEAATFAPPKYTVGGGCEQYRKLISAHNWDTRVMMAVMEAESSCVSSRVGDNYPINGVLAPSCGLLQVRTVAEWRGTCEQLQDPEFNVDIAYRVYQGQGMSAWSMYTNGRYLHYLR